MNRGYTLLWRKVWSNPLLCEPGKKFSRLEAWLYLTNVLYAVLEGKYDGPAASNNGNGGGNAGDQQHPAGEPGSTSGRRTSRGDPVYVPRQ
jgi:hypothetical protein